jgi:pilus assembly protein Flp/PilA
MTKFCVVLWSYLSTAADRVRSNDEGATAVEYGLMVALIAAVIIAIVTTLGTQVRAAFTTVSSQLP